MKEEKYFREDKDILPLTEINLKRGWSCNIVKREKAYYEVLKRIPNCDYDKIYQLSIGIQWIFPADEAFASFINSYLPEHKLNGYRFSYTITIPNFYERMQFELVVAATVHELTHVYLEHPIKNAEYYAQDEQEANDLVNKWGFQEERDTEVNFFHNRNISISFDER